MNPITVFAIGFGVFLLWYAFTGHSPKELISRVVPAAEKSKK